MALKLTEEQKKFAEEHHDLVYSFLWGKRLNPIEHYDVVIFGYLKAVQDYTTLGANKNIPFKAMAYHSMKCKLIDHWRYLNRKKRKAVIFSLDAKINAEGLPCHELVADSKADTLQMVESSILINELMEQVTPEEKELILLRYQGHTDFQIAKNKGIKKTEISKRLAKIGSYAKEMFCVEGRIQDEF